VLSLRKCRDLLGPKEKITDEELEKLRDQLQDIAQIAVSMFQEGNKPHPPPPEEVN
jgi:hypothetical protein